ncbi:MAG TPA: HNH endonuclease signature motif containing protein, partial [Planctomycetota bacterium]|nr:HNH endonuclease signature motif containing protein [Planctomycetota bacterium]
EVHHVVPRAAGGSNEAGNLATLCSRHHGLVHEGSLRSVRGEEGRLR